MGEWDKPGAGHVNKNMVSVSLKARKRFRACWRKSIDLRGLMVYIDIYQLIWGETMETRAKIFKNGRSQAIRLPREFRFEGDEVKISREGKKVVLEPLEKREWPKGFWKIFREDREFNTPGALPGKTLDLD